MPNAQTFNLLTEVFGEYGSHHISAQIVTLEMNVDGDTTTITKIHPRTFSISEMCGTLETCEREELAAPFKQQSDDYSMHKTLSIAQSNLTEIFDGHTASGVLNEAIHKRNNDFYDLNLFGKTIEKSEKIEIPVNAGTLRKALHI